MVSFDNPLRAILPPDFPSAGTGNCGMLEESNCSELEIWVSLGGCKPLSWVLWDVQCTLRARAVMRHVH